MKDFIHLFPKVIQENISASWNVSEKEAKYEPFPDQISEITKGIFKSLGITQLYKHQAESVRYSYSGKNIAIVTGTGSGKSLCYQIPVLDSLVSDRKKTSLMVFPTKALSVDQFNNFQKILALLNKKSSNSSEKVSIGIYDGDTPKSQRVSMRNLVNILITNPDMLHIGILPHHPVWSNFFSNLKFIIIDEIHIYKGVFGSHFTNVIRRLKRILDFYGSCPHFILTSATIGNPKQLAEKIIEEEIELIEKDHSNQNAKKFVFYNPPVTNQELGIRKSMHEETYQIASSLRSNNIQTIVFARTRNSVEHLVNRFNNREPLNKHTISGYRSGFLKSERRKIETGLKSRTLDLVISTTALELGIDIGTVEAVIIMGYPGSISRFIQQAGRAGRDKTESSLCILVASPSPLDQFFIRHPEFIKGKNPEIVLIDPNNLVLLFNHLKCAAFELPFNEGDSFGSNKWDQLSQFFSIFESLGVLYQNLGKYFWKSDQYPANIISLRSISGNPFMLVAAEDGEQSRIGEVDHQSAKKMIHPGAVYLHNGQSFLVKSLDFDKHIANLRSSDDFIFTEPVVHVSTEIKKQLIADVIGGYTKFFGEITINEKVIGFNRFNWDSREIINYQDLDMESDDLQTKGIWITFSDEIVKYLKKMNLWTNNKNNYGSNWDKTRKIIIERDHKRCQLCGLFYSPSDLHVHHKKPFRTFNSIKEANQENNLISLCTNCHRAAEMNIRMRSVLSGITYGFSQIAPLFLSCDIRDLGYTFEEKIGIENKKPGIIIYDQFPGGIGLAENLYSLTEKLFQSLKEIVEYCTCSEGCPSCIGPPGENGLGSKQGVQKLICAINL